MGLDVLYRHCNDKPRDAAIIGERGCWRESRQRISSRARIAVRVQSQIGDYCEMGRRCAHRTEATNPRCGNCLLRWKSEMHVISALIVGRAEHQHLKSDQIYIDMEDIIYQSLRISILYKR
jgi:hypothetical protein